MNRVQLSQNFIDGVRNEKSMKSPQETALWDLEIGELTGHNLEVKGREEVNELLKNGWILLHVYTLKYNEDGIWRERPMAILGLPRTLSSVKDKKDLARSAHGIPLQE